MSVDGILRSEASSWTSGDGPASDVVLSSRIRLARNISGYPFPRRLGEKSAVELRDRVAKAVPGLEGRGRNRRFSLMNIDDLDPLDARVLIEKHLISPQLARRGRGAGAIISGDQSISVMINEEDHLRIQCLSAGLSLERCWDEAVGVEEALAAELPFAFDETVGYLTTCPTNVGTGLRASVMMHLPAMVMAGQADRILGALSRVGVAIRGLYGEGTRALGNIFQVSNQTTLGEPEEEIISNLTAVVRQIIERERSTRERLYSRQKHQLEDQIYRAYGTLTHARIMSSEEAIALLSRVRLGVDLNILPHVRPEAFNELLIATRPGFLQRLAGERLDARRRDMRRASLLRQRLTK